MCYFYLPLPEQEQMQVLRRHLSQVSKCHLDWLMKKYVGTYLIQISLQSNMAWNMKKPNFSFFWQEWNWIYVTVSLQSIKVFRLLTHKSGIRNISEGEAYKLGIPILKPSKSQATNAQLLYTNKSRAQACFPVGRQHPRNKRTIQRLSIHFLLSLTEGLVPWREVDVLLPSKHSPQPEEGLRKDFRP